MTDFPVRPEEPTRYDATFVGRGFRWPMGVDHTGSIRLTDTAEDIERSIAIILMTAPGERLMRPRFGCAIWEMLFEPITVTLFGRITHAVRDALGQWEPRIDVESVEPTVEQANESLIQIVIRYRVKTTNQRHNLVYPFYVIPHEPE